MNFLAKQLKSIIFIVIEDHPQYKTHNIYEYKIPKILVIQSYTIPS
jgi:hypothetical protein